MERESSELVLLHGNRISVVNWTAITPSSSPSSFQTLFTDGRIQRVLERFHQPCQLTTVWSGSGIINLTGGGGGGGARSSCRVVVVVVKGQGRTLALSVGPLGDANDETETR